MGPPTHADSARVDAEGDAVDPPRRGRSTGLGTGTVGANGFARNVVLREATRLGVSREDRARLEALARFALRQPGVPGGHAGLARHRSRQQVIFEVTYTPDGPIAHRMDTEPDLLTTLAELDPDSFEHDPTALVSAPPVEPVAATPAPGPFDLSVMLAEAAARTPELMATFGHSGRRLLWANDSLRARLGVPDVGRPAAHRAARRLVAGQVRGQGPARAC